MEKKIKNKLGILSLLSWMTCAGSFATAPIEITPSVDEIAASTEIKSAKPDGFEYRLDILPDEFIRKFRIGSLSLLETDERGFKIVPLFKTENALYGGHVTPGSTGDTILDLQNIVKYLFQTGCYAASGGELSGIERLEQFAPLGFSETYFRSLAAATQKNIIFLEVGGGTIIHPSFFERLIIEIYDKPIQPREIFGGKLGDGNVRDVLESWEIGDMFRSKDTMTFVYHKGVGKVFYCVPGTIEVDFVDGTDSKSERARKMDQIRVFVQCGKIVVVSAAVIAVIMEEKLNPDGFVRGLLAHAGPAMSAINEMTRRGVARVGETMSAVGDLTRQGLTNAMAAISKTGGIVEERFWKAYEAVKSLARNTYGIAADVARRASANVGEKLRTTARGVKAIGDAGREIAANVAERTAADVSEGLRTTARGIRAAADAGREIAANVAERTAANVGEGLRAAEKGARAIGEAGKEIYRIARDHEDDIKFIGHTAGAVTHVAGAVPIVGGGVYQAAQYIKGKLAARELAEGELEDDEEQNEDEE